MTDRRLRKENDRLRAEVLETTDQLAEERSKVRILEVEQELLLAVLERDRRRVEAETQIHASTIVQAENDAERPNPRFTRAS